MAIVQDLRPAEEVVWDYYGSPIKAMRRTQLWRLADIHKISYPAGCSKENMLTLLDHQEVQGKNLLTPPPGMTDEVFWKLINGPRKQYNDLGGQQEGQTNVDLMRDTLEGKSHFETEAIFAEPETYEIETVSVRQAEDIGSLSWGDLKKRAKAEGHKVLPGMKRPEVESLLRG
ncbi:MAG: hypothetical protein ACR2QM_07795 [Longimicrobiales bacterium]